jgi:galacturan 1,4-alpha-galacturonidase
VPSRKMRSVLSQVVFVALAAFTSASPFGPPPTGPATDGKVCTVMALGHQRDDTPQILRAFEQCNDGGTVVFPENQNYWIATKLNPVIYDVTVDWKGIWTV